MTDYYKDSGHTIKLTEEQKRVMNLSKDQVLTEKDKLILNSVDFRYYFS